MNSQLLSAFVLACISTQVFCQTTIIPLYKKVPNSKTTNIKESDTVQNGIRIISNVTTPSLTAYLPAKHAKNKVAIIICPGGGYQFLAAGHEGADVAKEFASWGIAAFVLKYRLPNDLIMIDKTIGPLQDVQRAIQIVRNNAKKWDIDPSKLGIMGFSAGGHLASTASTHFLKNTIPNKRNISLKPDFSILIYPVISFSDEIAHRGSRAALLGNNITPQTIIEYSSDKQVTPQTPPAFLVHAKDDEAVKAANSIQYKEALERNGVQAELHIYEQGSHGFGMNNPTTTDQWMEKLKHWLYSSMDFKSF